MKKEILKKLQVILKVFVAIVLVFSTTTLVNAEDGDVDNIIFDVSGQLVEAKETSNQVKISLKITNTSETDLTLDSIKADIPEGVNYVSIEQENTPSQEDDSLLWTDQSLSAKKELVLTYELDVSKDASTQMSWYVNDEKLKEITDIKDILSEEDIQKIEGNATTKDGANLIQKEVSKVWTRFNDAGVVKIGNEDELRAFFTNSENEKKTAQLTSHINITNSNIISVQRNATLDLNGYSIYVKTGSENELFKIMNKASFKVQDSNGEHDNKETIQYKVTTVQGENKPVTETRTYTGGVITGNKKNTFRVESESTLVLENVCIYNNGKAADGYDGGAVINDGILYLNGALLVQNKGSWGGAIQTNGNSKIYINDNTILSENIAYRRGGAIHASGNAEIVMNDGYLTNNEANSTGTSVADGGGAIRLDGSSSFTMNNGYVTGNKSNKGGGGGIRAGWYDYNQYGPTNHVIVNINSGYISGNTAGNEGAGMSIGSGCHANIDPATNEKVYITYNTVTETEDWGGGGLFVANDGTMHITNLLVKDNHAGGFGGGIAGCSTGRVFDFSSKGGAIFDNSATGVNLSGNNSSKAEDHAYTQGNAVFHNSGYQDYFCALNSVIDNKMLGGGYEQWSGSIDNIPFSAKNNDEQLSSTFLMGMTANPIQEDKILAENNANVIVSHNSSYTHGGGILCNGYLVVGIIPTTLEIGDRLLVNAKKLVEGASHANNTFHFDLLDSDMKFISTMTSVGIDGKTNEGDINIAIPFSLTTNTGEFTYYLMEEPTDGFYPNTTAYKIVIKGERNTESNNVMGATVEKSVITDVTVTKGMITKLSNGTTTNKVFTEQGTVSITKDLNTGSNHAKLLNIEPIGYAYRNTVKPGSLTITKTSMGTTTPKDAVFTITGSNDYSQEVKYSEFNDGEYVLEGLSEGEYKVVESNADVKGYTLTVTGNGSTVNVNNAKMSQINIVNSYVSDKKASLIVYKVDQDGKFLEGANFQMEREDGEIINAIKDRARFEFKDLIDGTYTVKETTTPEGYEGIGEFEIVIEDGKITCPEYGITDPFVTLSVENTNDGTTPEVIGDEYDDDDFYPEVQGDEKVETSDNTNIAGFAGLSLLSAMMFLFLRKRNN